MDTAEIFPKTPIAGRRKSMVRTPFIHRFILTWIVLFALGSTVSFAQFSFEPLEPESLISDTVGGTLGAFLVWIHDSQYVLTVPEGASHLVLRLDGLGGNIDMLLRYNDPIEVLEDTITYDLSASIYEDAKYIEITDPPAGTYYIAVLNYEFFNVSFLLSAYLETGPPDTPTPTPTPTPIPTSTPAPDAGRLQLDRIVRIGPKPGNAQLPSYLLYNDKTNRLYVSSRFSRTISVVDGGTLAIVATILVDPWPGPMALHKERNKLYVLSESDGRGGGGGILTVIDTDTNTVLKSLAKDSVSTPGLFDLFLSEKYEHLFIADFSEKMVDVIDTENDTRVDTIQLSGLVRVGGLDEPRELPLSSFAFYDPYLLVTTYEGTLVLYDVLSGKSHAVDAGPNDKPYAIAIDPVRRRAYISTIGGQSVLVFDLTTRGWLSDRPVVSFQTDGLDTRAVAVDPEADRVYIAGTYVSASEIVGERVDKQYAVKVKILSASTLGLIATVDLEGSLPEFSVQKLQPPLAIDPITHNVLILNRVNATVVIFHPDGEILAETPVGDFPSDVAIDAQNRRAFVAGLDSDNIAVIDLDSGKTEQRTTLGEFVGFPVVSEEYNLVAVGSSSSDRVALIDGNSGSVSTFLQASGIPRDLEVDDVLGRLYIGGDSRSENPPDLDIVSLLTKERIASPSLSGNAKVIRVDSQDHRVYVATKPTRNADVINGSVDVFDGLEGERIINLEVGHSPVIMALDSANNRVYVCNSYDNTISIISTDPLNVAPPVDVTLPLVPPPESIITSVLIDSMAAYPPFETLIFSSPVDYLRDQTGAARYFVGVLDGTSGNLQSTVDLTGVPGFMLMDEDAGRVYVSTNISEREGAVTVIDAKQGKVIEEIPVGSMPLQLSRDRISGLIYVAVFGMDRVAVIDSGLLRNVATLALRSPIRGIAVNSYTHLAYGTIGAEGAVAIISDKENTTARPDAPAPVGAIAGDEFASLMWSEQQTAVKGYNVYRAFAPQGPYGRVNSETIPPTETTFQDTGLINDVPVYYKVTSVAAHNIESDLESIQPVSAIPRTGEHPDYSLTVLTGDNRVPVVPGVPSRVTLIYQSLRGFVTPVELSLDVVLPAGMTAVFSDERITVDELETGGKKTIDFTISVPPGVTSVPPVRIAAADAMTGAKKNLVLFVAVISGELRDISMGLSSHEIFFGEDMTVFGTVNPPDPGLQVELLVDGIAIGQGETDTFGHFSVIFHPPKPGEYVLNARLADGSAIASKSKTLSVLRGKSRVILTTNRKIDASTGPIPVGGGVTIQGQIIPNPGVSAVDLTIEKPSGTKVVLDGIVTTPAGFFGLAIPFEDAFDSKQRIRIDEPGMYRCQAIYHGNLNFLPSESEDLLIPVGIAPGDLGKAIVVAGSSLDAGRDAYRSTIDYLSALAYQTLRSRRFSDDDIYLINRTGERDIDGDGQNEADGISSVSMVRKAITEWAADRPADEPLVIYLVDHGVIRDIDGDGQMEEIFHLRGRLGADPENDLTSVQLASFLDALPAGKPVTIVIECCYSGSFVDNLAGPGRVIIASSDPTHLTYAEQDGRISFSQFLWNRFSMSEDLQSAFYGARQDVKNLSPIFFIQNPSMDDDGDGIPNEEDEGTLLAASRQIGYSFNDLTGFGIANAIPIIEAVSSDRALARPGAAEIFASVKDPDGQEDIAEVFATITPPDYIQNATAAESEGFVTPILNLERVELYDADGDSIYRTIYEGFQKPGAYQVSLFARDHHGHTAVVREISVEIEEKTVGKRAAAESSIGKKEPRHRSFVTVGVQGEEETTVKSWVQHALPNAPRSIPSSEN